MEVDPENITMDSELEDFNEDQRMQYLQRCVKLSQENKISIKNAFDIHLIDQMIAFCKDSTHEARRMETDFSLVSMSLQASGKIYGYRVDSLMLDTIRFVWELPNKGKRAAVSEDATESQRAKRLRLSRYLAEEGANDRPIEVDHSLLRHPVMDEVHCNHSNALGRLVSHNLLPPETRGIDLEGISSWWEDDRLEKVAAKRLTRIRKDLPLLIQCVELNFEMPPMCEVKIEDDSIAFDPQADPMPETEGIAPADIDDYDFSSTSCEEESEQSQFGAPGDFSEVYSSTFKSTGTNFAGPSSFRLKRYDILGTEKKCERGRKKKQDPKYLSFRDLPEDFNDHVPLTTGAGTKLSEFTMDRWTKAANSLPVDSAPSSFARLAELFAFPNRPIPEDEPEDAEGATDSHEDTSGTVCGLEDSGLGEDPFGTNGCADESESECEVPMSQFVEDLRYDNLISAPGLLAEVVNVAYAKTARSLDVQQMKQSFWKVLSNDVSAEKMDGEKSFRNLFGEAKLHMTNQNRLNINLPIAFVAMLSLCNEKHLVLMPDKDSADFAVSQAVVPDESKETNSPAGRGRPRRLFP